MGRQSWLVNLTFFLMHINAFLRKTIDNAITRPNCTCIELYLYWTRMCIEIPSLYTVYILTLDLLILSFNGFHLIWLIVHNTSLYVIIALILLLYTQVFHRVQFLALCFSPCILSLCLPLLTHTLSYIIHMLMTYNYICLLPQIEYLSYFTLCSHV